MVGEDDASDLGFFKTTIKYQIDQSLIRHTQREFER